MSLKTLKEEIIEDFKEYWDKIPCLPDHDNFADRNIIWDFINFALDRQRDEIIKLVEDTVKNSRTLDENLGIGKKEHTARMQALSDLLAKLKDQ